MLSQITLQNSIDFVHQMNPLGVNGSKMKQQGRQHTVVLTVGLKSFLKS